MPNFVDDILFPVFLACISILLVGCLACLGVELIQARQAFAASVACEARQMAPRRKFLSSEVACVPFATRQDTTTVKLSK